MAQNISPAKVQQYLSGVTYPASKDALLEYSSEKGAPQEVTEMLQGIPDKDYAGPAEVNQELSSVKA